MLAKLFCWRRLFFQTTLFFLSGYLIGRDRETFLRTTFSPAKTTQNYLSKFNFSFQLFFACHYSYFSMEKAKLKSSDFVRSAGISYPPGKRFFNQHTIKNRLKI